MNEVILSCRNLTKTFTIGKQDVPVLKGVNLDVQRGERIAIVVSSMLCTSCPSICTLPPLT